MPEESLMKQAPAGPVTLRKGPQGQEVQVGDSLSVAAAQQERAQIETAAMLAQMRPPRDLDVFRSSMLQVVEDPAIAEQWYYSRPAGRRKNAQGEWEDVVVTGPSIRAAEVALQHYGKVHASTRHIYENSVCVLLAGSCYDLENITCFSTDVMIEKTVERKQPRMGQRVIGVRENSRGETVYLVEASADEVKQRVAAERSKLLRDNGLRLIPRGILDEVGEKVKQVLAKDHAKDPAAAKKKIFDRFSALGVTPDALKDYLGRSLDLLTPKDISELTFIYNGLKQGDFTWPDLMATKEAPAEGGPAPQAAPDPKRGKLKDRLMKAREQAAPKPESAPESAPEPAPDQTKDPAMEQASLLDQK